MAENQIRVLHGGEWVSTDDVYVFNSVTRKFKEVLLAYYVGPVVPGQPPQQRLKVLFNKYQDPPTNLRPAGPVEGYSKAVLAWDAPAYATHYQVIKRSTAPSGAVVEETLPAGGWTQELTLEVPGLAQSNTYTFTVRAKRTAADGSDIVSVRESNKLMLAMGYPERVVKNPNYDKPAGTSGVDNAEAMLLPATKSDSWNADKGWNFQTGDVVEGYFQYAVRNGYGGVSWESAFSRLAALVKPLIPADVDPATVTRTVTVSKAQIDRVFRRSSGAYQPYIETYPWKANWTAKPVRYNATYGTFRAPLPGAFKEDFDVTDPANAAISRLVVWAREWIKEQPAYNGLLIYDTNRGGTAVAGYNGFAIFRKAAPPEWQLRLFVRWTYTVPAVPPTWSYPK